MIGHLLLVEASIDGFSCHKFEHFELLNSTWSVFFCFFGAAWWRVVKEVAGICVRVAALVITVVVVPSRGWIGRGLWWWAKIVVSHWHHYKINCLLSVNVWPSGCPSWSLSWRFKFIRKNEGASRRNLLSCLFFIFQIGTNCDPML
jgi:hypothetical protein